MSDTPRPTVEGQLIRRKRESMQPIPSVREMAKRAEGISEGRWRQIESGYESKAGMKLPAVGKAETIAAMLYALGGVSVGEYKALREARPDVVEIIDAREGGPRGIDALRRPEQPSAVGRLRQIRDELDRTIRQLENEDHHGKAPQPQQDQGRPPAGGARGKGGGRGTSIIDDEIAEWQRRHSNDLVAPPGNELLGAAFSTEGPVSADDLRKIEQSIDEEAGRGGKRDPGDVAEPVEDPRRPD